MKTSKISFDEFFNNHLNAAQQKAVLHKKGPLLVIAGAGSGKTRVITARILNLLINEKIDPRSIIALTFTNKAAGEMKERIHQFLPTGIKPFIGTFHSYCLQLLKTNAKLLDYPSFTIIDSDDQQQLLSSIIKKSGFEKRISAKNLSYQLSMYKNSAVSSQTEHLFTDPSIRELLIEYEREKKASKCLDFDDLLLEVLTLFKKNSEFVTQHQETIRHILVDEYQDTNITQHALLKAMAKQKNKLIIDSLCAVGDEDQSIYSWRGATVENMLHFSKDFAKTTLIKIEQNYRSVQPILEIANQVINHNQQRNPKNLWSEKKAKNRIHIVRCMSGYQESEVIAEFLKQLEKKDTVNSCAILYRAHYQSRTLEEALIRHSIPYKIIGGIQFYERKEIKDILAYLRLIANPFDRISFFRAINCPLRGLGDKFQELFYNRWNEQPFHTFIDCAQELIKTDSVAGVKQAALASFTRTFEEYSIYDGPHKTIESIVAKINYFGYLKNAFDKEDAETKTENIKELIRAAHHFEQIGINTIELFLAEVALMQEKMHKQEETENTVKLMTLHAAKGLEFDTIVLSGLEEGIFPSFRSINDPSCIEEERRLFYVGITRAKERLLLTNARYRNSFGNMTDQLPSRFLDEVPNHLAPTIDTSHWNNIQIQAFFSDWLGNKTSSSVLTFNTLTQNLTEKIKKSSSSKSLKSATFWQKNQTVKHIKFGVGIIKKVEEQGKDKVFITALFKSGIKKIDSSFLSS
ncbi:MAG: UvrD-helicase domain-containing protein [Candidatus Babeliales bacterium]